MSEVRRGGIPVFWQTLVLLLASLLVSQAVALTLILSLPQPRPDFNRLSDVADALSGRGRAEHLEEPRVSPAPPPRPAGMEQEATLTLALARKLEVAPERVRLFHEREQRPRGFFPMDQRRRRPREGVPMRRGEPIFFGQLVAGLQTPAGWRSVETPPPPLVAPWQRRLLLWFALSALVMVPFAWVFARAISRPIRSFAAAADRMGADPMAPAVPEQGPAELRTTAHALNRMQKRVADHLAERTAMIGAIAHDLRTPLARIAFRIEGAPDPMREKVQGDIEQMRAMISATIGFVKNATRSGERRPVDLTALVTRLAAQERELGHDAQVVGAAGPVWIEGDALALARLFQNLVDNGIAYGRRVLLTVGSEGGEAIVAVADDGPGLDPAEAERMFQPFERGDPSRSRATGGIGLGLTIARSIAEDHGGRIRLANRAEGGLEARVSFPNRNGARVT